jgi:hypothetical protein
MASPPTLEYVFGRDTTLDATNHYHAVPGCYGERLNSTNGIDAPTIDNNGNIVTACYLDTAAANGSAAVTQNRRIMLYGGPAGSANPLHLVDRDGPGAWAHLPNVNSWVTNSLSNNKGIQDLPIVTPGGTIFVGAMLNGTGATSSNNGSLWTGHDGSLAQFVQNALIPAGGLAPSTGGALFASSFADGLTPWTGGRARCNDAGQVAFGSLLTGGNVSGTTNNKALFVGAAGNIALVARKGWGSLTASTNPDGVQLRFETPEGTTTDTTGLTLGDTPQGDTFLGNSASMNNLGEVAFVAPLAIDATTGVTALNESCIWTNMGGTLRVIAREGDSTPWDPTLIFRSVNTSGGTPFTLIGQPMSRDRSIFCTILLDGAITPNVNDTMLAKYHWDAATSTGAWTPLIRKGDPCPLVSGATWGTIASSSRALSNGGVMFGVTLNGPGIVHPANPANGVPNDECLVVMDAAGNFKLVARRGSLVSSFGHASNLSSFGLPANATFWAWPDTAGALVGQSGTLANASEQVLFSAGIDDGSSGTNDGGFHVVHTPEDPNAPKIPYHNDGCLFLWDPVEGLMLLARAGTADGNPPSSPTDTTRTLMPLTFNGQPGTPVGAFTTTFLATGEGTCGGLTDNGWFVFRASDNLGVNNNSYYRGHYVSVSPYCSADFNHDGDIGTDTDIEAFFSCLAGNCCAACGSADFNGDGDIGTDADIESFFRVLAGGAC